jgi:plasmid maintenance system antidote protein VapI
MVYKGEIIKKAVDESGINKTRLAAEMGISRGTLYNIFNQIDVDNATILKIGRIIHYDFSIKFPKLKSLNKAEDPPEEYNLKTAAQLKQEVDHWKGKYITLLEEHNKLLKK